MKLIIFNKTAYFIVLVCFIAVFWKIKTHQWKDADRDKSDTRWDTNSEMSEVWYGSTAGWWCWVSAVPLKLGEGVGVNISVYY